MMSQQESVTLHSFHRHTKGGRLKARHLARVERQEASFHTKAAIAFALFAVVCIVSGFQLPASWVWFGFAAAAVCYVVKFWRRASFAREMAREYDKAAES